MRRPRPAPAAVNGALGRHATVRLRRGRFGGDFGGDFGAGHDAGAGFSAGWRGAGQPRACALQRRTSSSMASASPTSAGAAGKRAAKAAQARSTRAAMS